MVVDQQVRVILVVDDEPDVEPLFRQRMRREIRAGQYEFLFASSGLDALAILSDRTDIELVITDLNMPDMDGLELLAAMEDSFPGLPSMVVSAYGDPDRMARASEHGAGAFVVKPVDFPAQPLCQPQPGYPRLPFHITTSQPEIRRPGPRRPHQGGFFMPTPTAPVPMQPAPHFQLSAVAIAAV